MSTRYNGNKYLSENELEEILENLSESEDGLDFDDDDSVVDPDFLPEEQDPRNEVFEGENFEDAGCEEDEQDVVTFSENEPSTSRNSRAPIEKTVRFRHYQLQYYHFYIAFYF